MDHNTIDKGAEGIMGKANFIELNGIKKVFGEVVALDDVDFSVRQGTFHGLLGENGAGKST